RRRLALAIVVASGANFLVLDEPTNHLDLESREALEAALEAFPGTVLLVSHDRAVLDAVATRTIAVEERGLRSYDGGWADYVRARAERERPATPPPPPKEKQRKPAAPAPRRRASELERLAKELEALGGRVEWLGEHVRADFAGREPPVLLLGHLDTVWAHGTLAARPFRVAGERAYGPGVCDMKGGLAVALGAIRGSDG